MIRNCIPDMATSVRHDLELPVCCPVTGNPQPGSRLRVRYVPADGRVLPVEWLATMLEEYVGGLGEVRGMEHMVQDVAGRCREELGSVVRVRADLVIRPPQGGAEQIMVVKVTR